MSSLQNVVMRRAGVSPSGAPGRPRSARASRLMPRVDQAVAIVVALVAWHLIVSGPADHLGIPTPVDVARQLWDRWGTSSYWSAVGATLQTAGSGLVLSIVIGIPFGLIAGSNRRIAVSLQFVVDFMRSMPPVAIMPLLLVALGGTREMGVILIVLGAMWPLIIQSTYAMQEISPLLKQVATSLQLTRWQRIRAIYVPSALPFLMAGIRIAATISLLLAIVSEFFGAVDGLGRSIYNTLSNGDNTQLFVYSFTAAFLGMAINAIVLIAQRRLLRWHPSQRGQK